MKSKSLKPDDIIAIVDDKHKWKGNILQTYAEKVVRYAIPVEEIVQNNLSLKLLKELERQIKNKETISLQINSKPRLGKSTLAIALGMFIFEVLKKYGMKGEDAKFEMKNLARDQNEKIKRMRDPDLLYDVIVTDESNALEDTGENATVEKAQREVFSDVQAGRYIHGIWVCPDGTMDKNCDIKLEIRNKDNGLIHTRVYYFMKTSYYYGWTLVGVADFNVRKVIKNWLKMESSFFGYLRNQNLEDKKIIDKWSKKDFYVKYMCKKYEKMELMNREGILHARDLDYADIRKSVVGGLRPLAELRFINISSLKNNIHSKIEAEFRKRKMPISLIGREVEFQRVWGMLQLYRSRVEIEDNIKSVFIKWSKKKISEQEYNKAMTGLSLGKEELENQINGNEEQLNRLIELRKKYEGHLL